MGVAARSRLTRREQHERDLALGLGLVFGIALLVGDHLRPQIRPLLGGGDDQHPAWFLNLQANPDVEVAYKGGARKPMTAHVATAEERAELWPKVIANQKRYAEYQAKTEREIPLVLLSPR